MKWTEPAYAKINLTLDILGRLENGYHSLSTVMQSVSLCDQVTMTREQEGGILVDCGGKAPSGPDNIVWKAARIFFDFCGIPESEQHVRFLVEKNIPSQAGMGGGSSDGAAALRLLNRTYETGLSVETLRQLGSRVGADVPFCITGGTLEAAGFGEVLTPAPAMPDCGLLLCKPPIGVSTPEAFRQSDRAPAVPPKTPDMLAALHSGELNRIAACLNNRFEDILQLPEIEEIIARMKANGALNAIMTGSGSTVFGLYATEEKARKAALSLTGLGQIFVAVPVPAVSL